MAKFCSGECEDIGSICDFCKHYKDNQIIHNLKNFQGDGICEITKEEVTAFDGMDCEHFYCFRAEAK